MTDPTEALVAGFIGFAFISLCIWLFVLIYTRRKQEAASTGAESQASRVRALMSQLREQFDTQACHELISLANANPVLAQYIYHESLALVEHTQGTPAAKQFALHAGRISYSSARPDKRPTVYDEQAIMNDIAMRCAQ